MECHKIKILFIQHSIELHSMGIKKEFLFFRRKSPFFHGTIWFQWHFKSHFIWVIFIVNACFVCDRNIRTHLFPFVSFIRIHIFLFSNWWFDFRFLFWFIYEHFSVLFTTNFLILFYFVNFSGFWFVSRILNRASNSFTFVSKTSFFVFLCENRNRATNLLIII